MPFVLDASIVGCWCFHDEHDARADLAWDLLESKGEHALVPLHWWFEIRNVVLQAERRGRVTQDHTASNTPKKPDAMMVVTITTMVDCMVSFRDGQETLRSSPATSDAKPKTCSLRQAIKVATPATTKALVPMMKLLGLPK